VMIHQPWGGAQGTASDLESQVKEILHLKERLTGILAEHTGQNIETVAAATDRDNFLSAQEALDFGLVDKVIAREE